VAVFGASNFPWRFPRRAAIPPRHWPPVARWCSRPTADTWPRPSRWPMQSSARQKPRCRPVCST
jgi:hypothetical protein